MRVMIDCLIALMLTGILAGILLHHYQQSQQLAQYQQVHQALADLQAEILTQAALLRATDDGERYPAHVGKQWFDGRPPRNILAPAQQPWLDVAPPGDMADQPPDPVLANQTQGGFWYNPNRGVIRVRVPQQYSDQATLALYNRLNSTALKALPYQPPDPDRQPLTNAGLSDAQDRQALPDGTTEVSTAPGSAQGRNPSASNSTTRPSLRKP